MASANISLDQETIGKLIGGAIMQAITTEQRDTLISGALQHLLETEDSLTHRGKKVSPLQKAFNQAVEHYAQRTVMADLEAKGELSQKIHALIADAVTDWMTEGREAHVARVASAIAEAFGPRY